MKEFDRVDIGGARTAGEADFYIKMHQHRPCRQDIGRPRLEVLWCFLRKAMLREEKLSGKTHKCL